MSGITGRLYQQFALTIAVSVLISAFNALTLSPALSAMLLRPRSKTPGAARSIGRGFNRGFTRATNGYVSVNRLLVRKLAIPLFLLVGVERGGDRWWAGKLPSGFVPDEDQGYAVIGVQLPDGASLQRTRDVYAQVDAILAKQPGIAMYNGIAGFSFFTRTAASYTGTGFVSLAPWDERGAARFAEPNCCIRVVPAIFICRSDKVLGFNIAHFGLCKQCRDLLLGWRSVLCIGLVCADIEANSN